jgi:hypothetical protein
MSLPSLKSNVEQTLARRPEALWTSSDQIREDDVRSLTLSEYVFNSEKLITYLGCASARIGIACASVVALAAISAFRIAVKSIPPTRGDSRARLHEAVEILAVSVAAAPAD